MDATTGYNAAADRYLENEVLTAPPEKLHLMLIQGAIRFIRQAQQHWQADRAEAATECLIRAQEIVGEMLASLKPEQDKNLVSKVAGVYMFVFRSLIDAQLSRNAKALEDALRVLQIEEETWQQVCRQLAGQRAATGDRLDVQQQSGTAAPAAPPAPHVPAGPVPAAETPQPPTPETPLPPEQGFSLEA